MGFWGDLRDGFNDLKTQVQRRVTQFLNDDFADAAMALLAWVTAADGVVDDSEIDTVMKFIQQDDTLSAFDTKDLQTRFQAHIRAIQSGDMFAMSNIKKSISTQAGNSDGATLLVEVACILGAADGDFDDDEKKVVRQACALLNVNPAAFDV